MLGEASQGREEEFSQKQSGHGGLTGICQIGNVCVAAGVEGVRVASAEGFGLWPL